MKIQQLIETDLFRYQYEWENKNDEIIHMEPRIGRQSNSIAIVGYSVHYALNRLGINVPKRWNSTFAASDVEDNIFLQDQGGDGIRKVVIPEDRVVGYVEGDFNESKYGHFDALKFPMEIQRELHQIKGLSLQQANKIAEMTEGLHTAAETTLTNDEGYEEFVLMVGEMDKLLESFKLHTYTTRMVAAVNKFVVSKKIGAAPFAHLPEGAWEVWFEGAYEAHRDDTFDYMDDDEDGPDPYDRDR